MNLLTTVIVCHCSQNNKPTIKELSSSNGIITNPTNIANACNDYFINIGPTLANYIPKTTKNPTDYLNTSNNNSMFITCTDTEEILSIFALLKSNVSPGYDSISPKVVRNWYATLTTTCATYLINLYWVVFFSDSLKLAKVLPIYKADDRLSVSNYRPISVLPFFLKF